MNQSNPNMMKELEVALLLKVAKQQLSYACFLAEYPSKNGKRDFDISSPIDLFYRNVSSLAFGDGLLLTGSLIDKKYEKTMSFWRWPDYVDARRDQLQILTDEFASSGLKDVRDQVIAHQDSTNRNNNFPNTRRFGVRVDVAQITMKFLQKLVEEFYAYTNTKTPVYSQDYFDASSAITEIQSIIGLARPSLTDNFII